jgi:hypothetical protein
MFGYAAGWNNAAGSVEEMGNLVEESEWQHPDAAVYP